MAFPLKRTKAPLVEPISLCAMKNHLRVTFDADDELISEMISEARDRAEIVTARAICPQEWTFALDRFPAWRTLDGAPSRSDFDLMGNTTWNGLTYWNRSQTINIPRNPLLAVQSLTYMDLNGNPQTLVADTDFSVDLLSVPARLKPVYGGSWPIALPDMNSVKMVLVCGYGTQITQQLTPAANGGTSLCSLETPNLVSYIASVVDGDSNPVAFNYNPHNGQLNTPEGQAGSPINITTYNVMDLPLSIMRAIKLIVGAWYENREDWTIGAGNVASIPLGADRLLKSQRVDVFGYARGN